MKNLVSKLGVWNFSLKPQAVLKVKFSGTLETNEHKGHLFFSLSCLSHTLSDHSFLGEWQMKTIKLHVFYVINNIIAFLAQEKYLST